MVLDRFIYWNKDLPKPSNADIESIVRGFFGEEAQYMVSPNDRIIVTVPGKPSYPFAWTEHAKKSHPDLHDERWIEVWFLHGDKRGIDIVTRQADHFTNALAEGLASTISRYYQAEHHETT